MATTRALGLPLALLLASPLAAQDALEARTAALSRELDGLLEKAQLPGISIAIATPGGVVWSEAQGVRDARTGEAVGRDTVFEAASLSKPVFAYAVLQLVDEGLLELDTPLASYASYPDAAHDPRYESITARMILSHSGGFPNWRPDGGELELQFEPGARWQYSGEGFVFLQRTVEALTGDTIQEICRRLVFEPLEMTRSSFVWEERFAADHAVPHGGNGTARDKRRPAEGNAAWSLLTTATDYGRFLAAVLRGENLDAGTHTAMLTPQVDVNAGAHWGLGVGLEDNEDGVSLWHWGHNSGYRAYFVGYPSRGEAIVFFSNGDNGMLLLRDLVRLATGEEDHPALAHLDYDSYDSPGRLVAKALAEALLEHGASAGLGTYFELRTQYPEEVFDERLLNSLGYRLLNHPEGRVADAIEVFRLNVELYPEAFNPHDSLGEAYLKAGKLERALLSYERSLALNPGNQGGVRQIEEIRKRLAGEAREAGATR